MSFIEPDSKRPQSRYPLHPACIDSCFQAGAASLWSGHRSSVSSLMLPAIIDDLTIMAQTSQPQTGVAVANAEFTKIGRVDDSRRYKSNVSVYNTESGELIFRLSGLRYHSLEASIESHASHTYTQVTWKPDISFISKTHLTRLLLPESGPNSGSDNNPVAAKIGKVVELIAHKKPSLRVMEASLIDGADSVWIDQVRPTTSDIVASCHYHFSVPSQSAVLEAHSKYGSYGNVEFGVQDPEKPFSDLQGPEWFDLIILKVDSSPMVRLVEWVKLTCIVQLGLGVLPDSAERGGKCTANLV